MKARLKVMRGSSCQMNLFFLLLSLSSFLEPLALQKERNERARDQRQESWCGGVGFSLFHCQSDEEEEPKALLELEVIAMRGIDRGECGPSPPSSPSCVVTCRDSHGWLAGMEVETETASFPFSLRFPDNAPGHARQDNRASGRSARPFASKEDFFLPPLPLPAFRRCRSAGG